LQTFSLVFENTKPQILPDATFKNVPLGVNPTEWPLDVDFDKTLKEAAANPLYPGGQFRVYGDFCWGGEKGRAEAYFIPAGTKPNPNTNSRDPELAKKAMQQLIAQNMRGGGVDVGDTFALMAVPDDDKILEGSGDSTVARVVLYDNKAKRASAVDAKTVLSLKATKKPLPWLIILAVALGGRRDPLARDRPHAKRREQEARRRRSTATSIPTASGPRSVRRRPAAAAAVSNAASVLRARRRLRMHRRFRRHRWGLQRARCRRAWTPRPRPAVVQVRCPACSMMTMATPGQPSVCFSCGQPLPADIAGGGGAG